MSPFLLRGAFGAALLIALASALLLPSQTRAEDWNADTALALAQELDETLDGARRAALAAAPQDTGMQQRTRDAAVVAMKSASDASRELVQKLRLGWGRNETSLLLAQLQTSFDRALEIAGDAKAGPEVAPLLERSGELLFDLQKLYEPS